MRKELTGFEPSLTKLSKITSKGIVYKAGTKGAIYDRKVRRIVLEGYPVKPFNMTKEEQAVYFSGDSITCLLCGKKYRALNDCHLKTVHNTTIDEYKNMFGLPFSKGLLCGDLFEIRQFQGLAKTEKLLETCPFGKGERKKQRLNNCAISARRENVKIATLSKLKE